MRFTFDTDVHPAFTTYSAGNFAEVAPERLSPVSWSVVGVPVERGMRRLVARVLPRARWASGSHFVFVGYFGCAPFHNLSAFCHLAGHIPGVDPSLVTRCYFHGARVPPADPVRRSLPDGAAAVVRILRESARTRQGLRRLGERVTDLECSVAGAAGSPHGLCQLLPGARRLLDAVWEAHYAATMGVLPVLSLQDGLGRAVTSYWDELEPWVNRPRGLVWNHLHDRGFLDRTFYEVADDREPWSRYARPPGGTGGPVADPAGPFPSDPWDMVPLARLAQLPRVTWLVRTGLAQREATKALAMRTLHALRPVLPAVCAARGLRPDSWPYLAVDELSDPVLPAAVLQRRADRRAEECGAALAAPTVAPGVGGSLPVASGGAGTAGRGLGVCPGVVEGRVVRLGGGGVIRRDGTPLVLVCERADVDIHPVLSEVDAVVTARGSALSHVAILLREYGIPSVVGHPVARGLRDGQTVRVDGTTGEVVVSDG